jgi:hypothetical protein
MATDWTGNEETPRLSCKSQRNLPLRRGCIEKGPRTTDATIKHSLVDALTAPLEKLPFAPDAGKVEIVVNYKDLYLFVKGIFAKIQRFCPMRLFGRCTFTFP